MLILLIQSEIHGFEARDKASALHPYNETFNAFETVSISLSPLPERFRIISESGGILPCFPSSNR
jgi:hypothetical protein